MIAFATRCSDTEETLQPRRLARSTMTNLVSGDQIGKVWLQCTLLCSQYLLRRKVLSAIPVPVPVTVPARAVPIRVSLSNIVPHTPPEILSDLLIHRCGYCGAGNGRVMASMAICIDEDRWR